jgi:Xaa-Pro aminopeptidase
MQGHAMDRQPFQDHRSKLMAKLPKQTTVVIGTNNVHTRNHDVHFPFYPDSDFWYLTGIDQPGYVLVIQSPNHSILFCPPEDKLKMRWEGDYPLAKDAQDLGFDEGRCIDDLPSFVKNIPTSKALLTTAVQAKKLTAMTQSTKQWQPLEQYLHPLRLIKSDWEQQQLKQAARISCQAHKAIMRTRAQTSQEIDALFSYQVHRQGYKTLAYPSIVGVDDQACVLHYTKNKANIKQDSLILIDAGTTCCGYAADITRTFPNVKFTETQQSVYLAVLWVQEQIIKQCQVGQTWQQLVDTHIQCTQEAIKQLGFSYDIRQLCPHSFGHMVGLNVHDVPCQPTDQLKPGMCFTVEPGLYFHPILLDMPKAFSGIGIRIEDMILIQANGPEIITDQAPKSLEAILACRQQAQ